VHDPSGFLVDWGVQYFTESYLDNAIYYMGLYAPLQGFEYDAVGTSGGYLGQYLGYNYVPLGGGYYAIEDWWLDGWTGTFVAFVTSTPVP